MICVLGGTRTNILFNMSKSNLHKEKGKAKRGEYGEEFKDYPLGVKKFYDRRCGAHEANIERKRRKDKEDKKNFEHLRRELIDE